VTNSLQEQLRTIVKNQPASNYAVAKHCGIHQSAMSRFLTGDKPLSVNNLEKLSKGLDITVSATVIVPPLTPGRPKNDQLHPTQNTR